MAVKAIATITLHAVVDVSAVYRYYKLQSATLSAPDKPTVKPADPLKQAPSGWSVTELSYSEGNTDNLYVVDLNVFSDDTFQYSNVSLSSSYEAAKQAYNKAVNAKETAEEAAKKATDFLEYTAENGLILGKKSEDTWSGYRSQLLPDAFNILDADGTTLASYGAETISIGKNSQNSTIEMCDGLAKIYYAQEDFDDEKVLKIKSESIELAGSTTSLHSWYNYPHNQYNVLVSTYVNGEDVGIGLMVQHSTDSTIWTNNNLNMTQNGIESFVSGIQMESRNNVKFTAGSAILLDSFDGCVLMNTLEKGLYFSDDMDNWRTNKMNAMHMNESGHLRIGEGFYSNGKNTYIFGEDVYIRPSAANDAFRSYLKAGDEYEMYLPTAGYVYGSGKKVRFTIPLAKPVVGSPSVDVASVDGFILRQGGKFTHGSSDGVYVKPSSYSATLRGNGSFVDVIATFSANTNATSGDAIGILWNGKVSFGYG